MPVGIDAALRRGVRGWNRSISRVVLLGTSIGVGRDAGRTGIRETGARVVVSARDEEALASLVEHIRATVAMRWQ
jgi:NADP-dependent 3-hydroxy acid dehydrogenase YdfG